MGRPLGSKDTRTRWPLGAGARGSESSRILQRRLSVAAAGGGMSVGEQRTLTAHALSEFEREQVARLDRIFERSVQRVKAARRQIQRDDERASRHEAITGFDVEVRGSCGSDVHLGGDS